jgi:hypothetical protein
MISLIDKFLEIMFHTSFWHFCGSIFLVMILTSLIECIYEKTLDLIGILVRGHPQIVNKYTVKDKENEPKSNDESIEKTKAKSST